MAMNEQMDSSLDKLTLYKFARPALRDTIAKDQLIFSGISQIQLAHLRRI